MLSAIGQKSVDDVVSKTVPSDILFGNRMDVDQGMSERDTLALAIKLAAKNTIATNFIGQGYYATL
jgi:glycine dehydrogenase